MIKNKCKGFMIGTILGWFLILGGCSQEDSEALIMDLQPVDTVSKEFQACESSLEVLPESGQTIFVHICGAVVTPGVYEVKEGTRIFEVVEQCGGMLETADTEYLNLAQTVSDGTQIYVYTKDEVRQNKIEDHKAEASGRSGLVNINTASMTELTSLTGIGEGRAKDIIAYREQNGSFKSIDQIMKVSGIKDGLYKKIKDKITVN